MNREARRRKKRGHLTDEFEDRRTPPGSPPGTLTVDPAAPRPVIRCMAYSREALTEIPIDRVSSLPGLLEKWPVVWINVDGLGDAGIISALGELFHLHRLALEDVVNVYQRPKMEIYDKNDFVVVRMVSLQDRLETEQLSIFLGKNFVLTFQEKSGDCFDPVRTRLRNPESPIRGMGPDYLVYSLLDAVVDHNFPVLETLGEKLEELEDEVVLRPGGEIISEIHKVKRDLLALRRAVWPLREVVNSMLRETTPSITAETRIYLRDCYDHLVQIIDLMENYRDVASSLTDMYLSSVSNRLNEIMKILTMFTTIFIPMSFIAGLYGMNFSREASPWNMPELGWYYGYFFALGLTAVLAVVLLFFFRSKGWLGSSRSRKQNTVPPLAAHQ